MSNVIETIDLDEDLDYELDVEMDTRIEDALLNDDDDEKDHENDLVRKMSMTSVSTVEPPLTVASTEPLPKPLCPPTTDIWGKSISTFVNVMHTVPIKKTVEPQNSSINRIDVIKQPVMEVIPPVQDVCNEERQDVAEPKKLETVLVEPDVDPTSPDQKGINLSDATLSSSSTSSVSTSSPKKFNSKMNRNKNKARRFVNRNALSHGIVLSKSRIPSLMSIKTHMPFSRTRFPVLLPETVPTESTRKKVPFIIKAKNCGESTSRTVTVNPEFEGFPSTKVSNKITTHNGNRRLSSAVNSLDFSNIVINKRRSTTSLESISDNDKKATELSALPMVIDMGEMSDGDRKYLLAIEEQKKKREEVLRQKEWKRDQEGWQFLED